MVTNNVTKITMRLKNEPRVSLRRRWGTVDSWGVRDNVELINKTKETNNESVVIYWTYFMDFLPNIIPYSGEVTATEVKIMSTMIGVSKLCCASWD